MKTTQPNPPRHMFHGNELMRLLTMVVMLGVLLLLIVRSSDPNTWAWLTNDAGAVRRQNSPTPENNQNDKINPQETMYASAGPTDQDPQESEAAAEEFQAVADGKLSIEPQEMPAYNRLLQWVRSQTLSELHRRAKKDPIFTQFYQSPDKYRGQLFELQLNLRRIIQYEHNGLPLSEVWGWTDESRSWLYAGVVIDLPKGMPVGPDIYERADLVGYFFKMQGYMEAGAKPHAAPLQAPLFVGRLIWHRTETPQTQPSDRSWAVYLLVAFLIFLIVRWGRYFQSRCIRAFIPPAPQTKSAANPLDDWLANVESDESAEKNNSDADPDSKL